MLGIGEILKEFNLKQKQCSELIEADVRQFNDWVKGRRKIPKKWALILSKVFGLPSDYFDRELTEYEQLQVKKAKLVADELKLKGTINENTPIIVKFMMHNTMIEIPESKINLFGISVGENKSNKEKTLDKTIDVDGILSNEALISSIEKETLHLTENDMGINKLKVLVRDKIPVYAWGNKESYRSVWEIMRLGEDVLAISAEKSMMTHFTTMIEAKIYSPELSQFLWGSPEYCYIYFFSNMEKIQIPRTEFNRCFGYSEGFTIRSLTRLNKIYESEDIREKVIAVGIEKLIKELNQKQIEKAKAEKKSKRLLDKYINKFGGLEKFVDSIGENIETGIESPELEGKVDKFLTTIDEKDLTSSNSEYKSSKLDMQRKGKGKDKNTKPKTSENKLSSKMANRLGWFGERFINRLLQTRNQQLLDKLDFDTNEQIETIIWYNEGFHKREDWEDQSYGHDIKLKTNLRDLKLEIKTSFNKVGYFTITGNELANSYEQKNNYYVIKIDDFKQVKSGKVTITIENDPLSNILQNPDRIRDLSMYY